MTQHDLDTRKRISKFLSLVLRHQPEKANLTLDEQGWASVDAVLIALKGRNLPCSMSALQEVVDTNDKKRFVLDGDRIRASQGHSVNVDLGFVVTEPPGWLYHGTVEKFLDAIFEEGLAPGTRQYVHLSADKETATKVGSRRGRPVILKVASGRMHGEGLGFFLSVNGVWLTEHVPVRFLELVS